MRGKATLYIDQPAIFRITPAYAGKSYNPRQALSAPRDHPRLCGEKRPTTKAPSEHEGSPPPMRGKVLFIHLSEIVLRITPAYAGKSFRIVVSTAFKSGSPPPMRGKVPAMGCFVQKIRITPAYAGKRGFVCKEIDRI